MKQRAVLLALLPLLLLALLAWIVKYLFALVVAPAHGWQLAIAADQLANAAFNGDEDSTISSRAYYHSQDDEHRECWAVWLCKLLDKIDPNHCEKSKGV